MRVLALKTFGGPEVLEYLALPDPEPEPGCMVVQMQAVGLNFADIYRRRGNYVLAGQSPHVLGYEGAGSVKSMASDVSGFKPGDRVAFADVPFANATLVSVPVEHVIRLPAEISDVTAAALLLQGLTAQYLCEDSVQVRAGDHVAIHAAAGGVGRLLIQMCKAKGAIVHALVSSEAKAQVALAAGADEVLLTTSSQWSQTLQQVSGGMRFVFDSVGSTLSMSLSALRPKGRVILFGLAGGEPPALTPRDLMAHSTGVVGGDLWDYLDSASSRQARADRLFDLFARKIISLPAIETFALRDGVQAHRRLEGREFAGKIVLLPSP